MARGNKRGGNGGSNDRGRGQPSRGRGQRGRPFQRGGGGGAARNWREEELDLDFSIDIRDVVPRGFRPGNRNRGRGRGRGGGRGGLPAPGTSTPGFTPYNSPLRGLNGSGSPSFPSRGGGPSQRGSPSDSGPKDRSRKRILDKKLRTGTTPLSQLLCRPYLRPIEFVRSELTPYLFMDEEEIFKPVVEESGQAEASHVPTADAVLRVFKTGPSNAPLEDIESTDLEEIDFNDLHRAVAEIEEMAADKARWENQPKHQEEVFTGVYFDTIGSTASIDKRVDLVEDPSIGPLGSSEVDDEVIVYIAPHPRSGRAASPNTMASIEHPSETEQPVATPGSPTIPSERLSTVLLPAPVDQNLASSIENPIPSSSTTKVPSPSPPSPPLSITQVVEVGLKPEVPSQQLPTMDKTQTPPHRRLIRNPHGVLKQRPVRLGKRLKDHPLFGSFGAILSEARLRGERDPRRVEQRRGDSDVDWGSESEGETSGDEDGDMDVDPDIQLASMEQFVRGMGVGGSMHKSAGDLEDDAQIASEDESEGRKSSSTADGEDAQFAEPSVDANQPEALSGDNPSSSDDDDDDDDSPEGSFYARLRSLREQSADPRLADPHQADEFSLEFAWDEEEDDYPAWLEKYLAAHSNIDTQDPLSEDDELDGFSAPARRRRDKGKDLPPELQEQWKRDRAKKAEYKRQRDEARLLTAADSLAHRKGGKKGRKAARLAIEQERPNAVVDVNSLEQQMRRFLADLGGAKTMSLPPMAKESRKIVHELALAFNLKSHSKGNGLNRYTSLVKTSRSGIKVNEGKVTAVVRRSGGVVSVSGRGGRPHGPKPKEGDIVGKEAPKIGGSNIGFKMLSAMGWEDGDRIGGATGGLDVPLTAVVKMSKLGLGAAHKPGK